MKEFMSKHPILAIVAISIICSTAYNCVRIIKYPEAAKMEFDSTKSIIDKVCKNRPAQGEEKGA